VMAFVLLAVTFGMAAPAGAADCYVGSEADPWTMADESGCKDPNNTTCSLRAALAWAGMYSPSTIHLPAGRFHIDAGSDDLIIWGSVTIKGEGPDKTIIDGGRYSSGRRRTVLKVLTWNPITVRIQDLSIVHGYVRPEFGAGGAIDWSPTNPAARLELSNVVISANEAPSGGGLHLAGGEVIIEDSVIQGNIASAPTRPHGAGINIVQTTKVTIRNTTIEGNEARGSD